MSRRTSPRLSPFRADHVGSLLRPPRLHQAREDFAAGRIEAAGLRAVEDEEITRAVRMQEQVGLQSATDGEFRRATWHMDFIYQIGGISKAPGNMAVKFTNPSGTIEWTPAALHVGSKVRMDQTIFGEDFAYLKSQVSTAVPKQTIPSPNMVHYRGGPAMLDPEVYPDIEEFWSDLAAAYADEVRRLNKLGCTYLQFDDTSLAYLNDPAQRAEIAGRGEDAEHMHLRYIKQINAAVAGKPADMAITTHLCRGNFRSSWAASGGYDFVAEALFSELAVDGFFLEYDDERSGGFEPLRFVPQGQDGRPRPGHHQASRAGVQGRSQAADRRGGQVRAAGPDLPVRPVRVLLHGGGQRADLRRAGGQAASHRRDRPRHLGRLSRGADIRWLLVRPRSHNDALGYAPRRAVRRGRAEGAATVRITAGWSLRHHPDQAARAESGSEADELTAELTASYWRAHDQRLAETGFFAIARQLPGLIGQAIRLG